MRACLAEVEMEILREVEQETGELAGNLAVLETRQSETLLGRNAAGRHSHVAARDNWESEWI